MAAPRKNTPSSGTTSKPIAAAPAPIAAPAVRSEVKGSGTVTTKPATKALTHEAIAQRAFEIYAGRGYAAGNPNADWLEAERQLKAGL